MAGEKQTTPVIDVNESYPPSPMPQGMLLHSLSAPHSGVDPRDKCFHELFKTQVERMPNAVALVYTKEEVSYRELDNQANRVARHLRSLCVAPDMPVVICVRRSTDMR